jgi:two-component system cell cycle sensor histidine kinase/response regulator CckA
MNEELNPGLMMQDIMGKKRVDDEIQRGYDTQNVINSLLRLSLENTSLEEILKHALDLVLSISWLALESRGAIFLVEEGPEILTMKAHNGLTGPIQKSCTKIPFGRCLCGRAASIGEIQFAGCIDDRHEILYEDISPHGHYCIPILFSTRILGVLNIYIKEGHQRNIREEEFLTTIANTLAGIITRKQAEEALRESEERYRTILENIEDGYFEVNIAGNFTFFNDSLCRMLGYTKDELMGRNNRQYMNKETAKKVFQVFNQIYTTGEPCKAFDWEVIRKDGTKRFHNSSVSLIRDSEGKRIGFRGIIRDVTERIQAEKAVTRLSQENAIIAEIGRIISSTLNIEEVYERFAEEVRKLIPFDRIVINTIDIEKGTVINVYMAGKGITDRKVNEIYPLEGSGNAEMVRIKSTLLIQTEDFNEYKDRFPMLLSTFQAGFRSIMNVPLFSKGQIIGGLLLRSYKPYAYTDRDVKLAEKIGDQIAGAIANAQLFNERKQAEEALRVSETRFRHLFDDAPVGYHEFDTEGRITRVNRTELEMLGYTEEEMLGRYVWNFIVKTLSIEALKERLAGKLPPEQAFERTYRRKDGTTFPALIQERFLKDDGGRMIGIRSTIQDITELKRAEEALRESEDRYRDLVEHSQDLICTHDLEGQILSMNQAAMGLLGHDRNLLLRMNIRDILAPEYREGFEGYLNEIKTHGVAKGLMLVQTRTGEKRILEYNNTLRIEGISAPIVRSMAHDITERKQAEKDKRALEEQLRQSQKMEAIGRLAGGVAHDFNNLLTVIQGYSDLILKDLDEKNRFFQDIMEIKKASDHATSLTRQLLAFSRKQILQPKVLDINSLVLNIDKMLRRMIGEDIELVTLLSKDLGRVKADPGQVEQVILNLAVNARDAMPKGGKLTIETANAELDETYARSRVSAVPGRYVRLSISDTGIGMTPEVRERIFEPFFTTKEKSKGTGLGLSTVYGIVKQSGGNIWVYSEPHQGTTFKIYLPMIEEKTDSLSPTLVPPKSLHGSETILLVEDEEAVRKLASTILQNNGYKVLEAGNGEEALHIAYEQPPQSIDLMLTDVVMPGMSGSQLTERVKPTQPAMKVLYMSGYTDNAIVHHGILDQGTAYLQKPFTPNALAEKVRDVLDGT